MPHNTSSSENMPQLSVPNNHIQIGGRKSKLAVIQSEIVKEQIEHYHRNLTCSVLALSTLGDKIQNRPLYSFGGKSLWTKELEILLLEAVDEYPKLDLIVHSLKDMPTNLPDEFELGCILEREDPRDALIMKSGSSYKSLDDLPHGAVVGTSSIRRSAQLLKNYPHLRFQDVRGNIYTRLSKLDDPESPYECLILAAAGLIRLGLENRITACLDAPQMYHAVGQGALGVEIRRDDLVMQQVLSKLEHKSSSLRCTAERSLMRVLEGGCSVPLGVSTKYNEETQELDFKGIIVSPNGEQYVEGEINGTVRNKAEAEQIGEKLAEILVAKGGRDILKSINYEKINQRPSNGGNGTPDVSTI
ncbi:porphobilinogen deaminase [Candidozyma auris]|nr:porphobilinogen deaminase [[Candida] auris]QEL58332.1 porphobilinogen deaminase [[Candida] auris]